MDNVKKIKDKLEFKLHKLYYLIKAEWYGDQDDISDNFDEWADEMISDACHDYEYEHEVIRADLSLMTYIEEMLDEEINHYYLLFGKRLLERGARVTRVSSNIYK